MDKREGLRAGIVEMRSVAQRLNQWADDLEASFRGQEAPAGEVPASEPQQAPDREKNVGHKKAVRKGAEEPAAVKEERKALSLPEVRAILAEKCAAGFGTQVKALIESYGAASLKGVPPEKYEELLEAVKGWGEPLSTAGGGNLERGEVNRNKRAPQCGVASIEVAEQDGDADAG